MRQWVKATLGLALVLIAANWLVAGGARGEGDKLDGTWQFVKHEHDGKVSGADDTKKMTVTIKGEKWSVKFDDKVVQAGTQKLDPTKKPKTIDAKVTEGDGKGDTMLGIYKVDGDTMTVCFDPKGKNRPTEFKTTADSGLFLAVVKRVEK